MKKTFFIILQYLIPQRGVSRIAGYLADTHIVWLKNALIKLFTHFFKVNMQEAEIEDPYAYASFNAFFCRQLKIGARQFAQGPELIANPVDGCISAIGDIDEDVIFQAKGRSYTTAALLGGNKMLAESFKNGKFATLYLAPHDYHRVHMPCEGVLRSMSYIPGKLFSVNQTTAENVNNLFARNERVVCVFDTAFGPMALVLVGAMIVGSVETSWAGQIAPPEHKITTTHYARDSVIAFKQGEEMGRFKLGSTVIMLLPPKSTDWDPELKPQQVIKLGQRLGLRAQQAAQNEADINAAFNDAGLAAQECADAGQQTNTLSLKTCQDDLSRCRVSLQRISDEIIAAKGKGLVLTYGCGQTPFGQAFITWENRGILHLAFSEDTNTEMKQLRADWPEATFEEDHPAASRQLTRIFTQADDDAFTLWVKATDFQLAVWQQLLGIQAGQTCHYKDIAVALDKPTAARAVGSAVGANPVAYLIPCHRVIPVQDHGDKITHIGGYRWGEKLKEALLKHEHAAFMEQ